MADNPTKTYCPVCERPIKTNARGLLHRHKPATDRYTRAEVCPGSGHSPVDEATIIAAVNRRRRQALCQIDPMAKGFASNRAPLDSKEGALIKFTTDSAQPYRPFLPHVYPAASAIPRS